MPHKIQRHGRRTPAGRLAKRVARITGRLWNRITGEKEPVASASPAPGPAAVRHESKLIGLRGHTLGYYNMPKAGCTTIKNILYYIEQGKWLEDPLEIHRVVKARKALLRGAPFQRQCQLLASERPCFQFTYVRHPGRRVFSSFVEKILTSHRYAIRGVQLHLMQNYGLFHRGKRIQTPDDLPDLGEMTLEDIRVNFEAFLAFVERNLQRKTRFHPNPHWTTQSGRIAVLGKADRLHHVGRIEQFAEDFPKVLEQAGISDTQLGLKRFNEGPKPPFRYEDMATDRILRRVRMIYAEDFTNFGYEDL